MKKKITILLIIIVACSGMFFVYKNNTIDQNQTKQNRLEYHNVTRNFSLQYPQELRVKEYDEGDTTYTIVFADETDEKSFQIFFTPYLGDQITKSRILKDVPSGKFTEPIEIVIDNDIHALAFFSWGELGEMREIWFIHNGYLFEITTYKEFDNWLAGIMQSWQFYTTSPAGN